MAAIAPAAQPLPQVDDPPAVPPEEPAPPQPVAQSDEAASDKIPAPSIETLELSQSNLDLPSSSNSVVEHPDDDGTKNDAEADSATPGTGMAPGSSAIPQRVPPKGYIPITRPCIRDYIQSCSLPGVSPQLERVLILLESACMRMEYKQVLPKLDSLEFQTEKYIHENLFEILKMCEIIHTALTSQSLSLATPEAADHLTQTAEMAVAVRDEVAELMECQQLMIFEAMSATLPREGMRNRRRKERTRDKERADKELQKVLNEFPGSATKKYEFLLNKYKLERKELSKLSMITGMKKKIGYPQLFYTFAGAETDGSGYNLDISNAVAPVIYDLTSFVMLARATAEVLRRRLDPAHETTDGSEYTARANYEARTMREAMDTFTVECKNTCAALKDFYTGLPYFVSSEDARNAEKVSILKQGMSREAWTALTLEGGAACTLPVEIQVAKSNIVWQIRSASEIPEVVIEMRSPGGEPVQGSREVAPTKGGGLMIMGFLNCPATGEYNILVTNKRSTSSPETDGVLLNYRMAIARPRKDRAEALPNWVERMVESTTQGSSAQGGGPR